jgi:hypothetical protein
VKLFISFCCLLLCFVAKAQFKQGTFSVGVDLNIQYDKTNYASTVNYSAYSGYTRLGINASVFLHSQHAIGLGIQSISYSGTRFNVNNLLYALNYEYYYAFHKQIGFINRTSCAFGFDDAQNTNLNIKNTVNIGNGIGLYAILYKGFCIKLTANILNYSYLWNKTPDEIEEESKFKIKLNPLENINNFEFSLVYLINTVKNEH